MNKITFTNHCTEIQKIDGEAPPAPLREVINTSKQKHWQFVRDHVMPMIQQVIADAEQNGYSEDAVVSLVRLDGWSEDVALSELRYEYQDAVVLVAEYAAKE